MDCGIHVTKIMFFIPNAALVVKVVLLPPRRERERGFLVRVLPLLGLLLHARPGKAS